MNWAEETVGGYVVAKYAGGRGEHGSGRVVAYCAQPSFVIEQADGTRFSWRADMCEPTTEPAYVIQWDDGTTSSHGWEVAKSILKQFANVRLLRVEVSR